MIDEKLCTCENYLMGKNGRCSCGGITEGHYAYKAIKKGICPQCWWFMERVKNTWDWECEVCGILYHFMDDMGPGSYIKRRI